MESIESYRNEVLARVRPLVPEELSLAEALGAVLAQDVTATWPIPGFDNSAMDGYAVRAADVASATPEAPVCLPVDGEAAAGDTTPRTVTRGRAIKIMTGALLPDGADAVVPVEWTDGGAATKAGADAGSRPEYGDRQHGWPSAVVICQSPLRGNAVRLAGADAQPGDVLLTAGTAISAAQIGVLAAAGFASVLARRRPRVAVFSTGNELSEPGDPLVPGQIWDSNSFMLVAAARQAGCDAIRHPVVRDTAEAVLAAVEELAGQSDLLVTTGGVSMGGEHDAVKAALTRLGTVSFRKVAMQPGMPQGFGLVGQAATPILTLPGNPVSAYVSFRMFGEPVVQALQHVSRPARPALQAVLTDAVRSPEGRRSFLRGVLDRQAAAVAPLSGQESHRIASLGRANALIVVPEPVTELAAGEIVDVLELP